MIEVCSNPKKGEIFTNHDTYFLVIQNSRSCYRSAICNDIYVCFGYFLHCKYISNIGVGRDIKNNSTNRVHIILFFKDCTTIFNALFSYFENKNSPQDVVTKYVYIFKNIFHLINFLFELH